MTLRFYTTPNDDEKIYTELTPAEFKELLSVDARLRDSNLSDKECSKALSNALDRIRK